MKVNIFTKYKVHKKCKYSYKNEYGDFSYGHCEWTKELYCHEFLKLITDSIKDDEFCSISIVGNKIYIDLFNPNTGETSDIYYTYEEIEGDICKG